MTRLRPLSIWMPEVKTPVMMSAGSPVTTPRR